MLWQNLGGTNDSPGVKYEDLAYTTENGFASYGTNNGHNGTSGVAFYQNPDVVTDFAWRACVLLLEFTFWIYRSLSRCSIQTNGRHYEAFTQASLLARSSLNAFTINAMTSLTF